MVKLIRLVRDEFRASITSAKVLLGLSIGLVLTLRYTLQLIRFSIEIAQPVNVFEPFIYVTNNFKAGMFVFLGLLLVLTDAPFINARTTQLICRVTRKTWNISIIVHIAVMTACYYAFLLAFSAAIASVHGYAGTSWSIPMVETATRNQLAAAKFDLLFEYYNVIQQSSIIMLLLESYFTVFLYGVSMGLIIYVFNLSSGKAVGTVLALGIHFISYITYAEGLDELSLFSYSLAAAQKPCLLLIIIIIIAGLAGAVKCQYADLDFINEE